VIWVSTPMPSLGETFCNLIWANLPKEWIFNSVYHQNTVFISIIIEIDGGNVQKINRGYPLIDVTNMSKDMWGFACDCAEEIIHTAQKN